MQDVDRVDDFFSLLSKYLPEMKGKFDEEKFQRIDWCLQNILECV